MQTAAEKVGYDVACPHCAHRFRLVEQEGSTASDTASDTANEATLPANASPLADEKSTPKPPPQSSPIGQTPANPYAATASPVAAAAPVGGTYSCPYCQSTSPPLWKSEESQVGWIVFAILLVTTCIFCFAGLFIRDKFRVCSKCRVRLG
jgi:hypothetical protein